VIAEGLLADAVPDDLIAPWQRGVGTMLAGRGVSVGAYVPDKRLEGILQTLGQLNVPLRSLTREEECVGYAAGQRIVGKRPVVLLQSSGLGNALNALGSLVVPYRLGFPLVVSMRGQLGENNPSQVMLGRAASALLSAVGIQSFSVRTAADASIAVDGACTLAYEAGECSAVLLDWRLGAES
jgi:sulfopyruvate decarboxylase subunit alpha